MLRCPVVQSSVDIGFAEQFAVKDKTQSPAELERSLVVVDWGLKLLVVAGGGTLAVVVHG